MNLAHPAVQSVLAPLLIALACVALLRGRRRGAGIAAGLLAALLLMRGLPWPPRAGLDKLPWLVAGSLALGLLMDGVASWRRTTAAATLLATGAALLWLAAPQLGDARPEMLLQVAALLGAAALVTLRLPIIAAAPATASALMAAAAAGLAVVGFNGGSLVIAQAALALAVTAGATTVVAWLTPAAGFGPSAVLGGGGAWVLLLGLTVLLTDASRLALALLPLAFLADLASRRLPAAGGRLGAVLASLWAVAVAALPLALAVYLSLPSAGGDGLYYQ